MKKTPEKKLAEKNEDHKTTLGLDVYTYAAF